MQDSEISELRDRFYGLSAIVSMMLSMMDRDEDIHQRLLGMEHLLRQENAPSGTIEIIKAMRSLVAQG